MNETDLEMERGADLHSAAGPVDMSPSFKRWKAGAWIWFCILKKHYFHGINLKHVTTTGSQGWLSLRWSTICLFFHTTQNPGPVTSVKPQLRSLWQRAVTWGTGWASSQSTLAGSLPALAEAQTLVFCAESASAHHHSRIALTWPQVL